MLSHRNAKAHRTLVWTAACLSLPLVVACGSEESSTTNTTTPSNTEAVSNTDPATEAKSTVPDTRPPSDIEIPQDHPLFGRALVINGEVIAHDLIKRHLVLGSKGMQLVESRKLDVFMTEEIGRRKAAGEDVSKYEITDSDIDGAIAQAEELLEKEYPGQDMKLEDAVPTMRTPLWRDQVRQSQAFDKLFLPENPHDYPEVTQTALIEGTRRVDQETGEVQSDGNQLWEQMKEGWDEKKRMEEETGEMPQDDPQSKGLLTNLMRQLVLKHLDSTADVRRPEDGIPSHLAMIVNSREVDVESIWKLIESEIGPDEIAQTKRWFVNTTLARQSLEAAGHWLDDARAKELYAAHSDPYKESPFSIEMVAMTFKKFPSVSDYKLYHRITESYKLYIADEITNANLMAHGAKRTNRLVGMGKVDCDIILLSAFDFAKGRWRENGWEDAKQRAVLCMKDLASETKTWEQCVEEYSDFYDAPIPQSTQGQVKRNDKGRFVQLTRNELLQRLQESEYSIFLTAGSIGDFVFFQQEIGTPSQPLRGPHGYYIPLLKKRSDAVRQLSVGDPNHRTLLEQEFVSERLVAYIQQQHEQSEVRGL